MFDVRAGDRVGMERLDVEHDRDNVRLQPETSAQIGCLEMDIRTTCED